MMKGVVACQEMTGAVGGAECSNDVPRVGRAAKAMIMPIRIATAMMIAWTSRCREYLRKVARMTHPLPPSILHGIGPRQEKAYPAVPFLTIKSLIWD